MVMALPSARPPEGGLTPSGREGAQRQGCTSSPALTKVTLLLSIKLKDSCDAPRPLTRSEYHHLATWLDARSVPMTELLLPDAKNILRAYPGADRILHVLRHVSDVDRLLEHWQQLGIWVLGERDSVFPSNLRQRLRAGSLPLLFGAGPMETLNEGGACVVGSRDCVQESLDFARLVGSRAGSEGLVVISSDMRGIDREVISAALSSGGRVICVLSDSFEKAVASKRYREALETGRATLVTPFMPDSHFVVANAMRANRYQYALSDAAIIVEARQSGGIWSGADENRKHRWVPAFVRTSANTPPANSALLHLGLLPITHEDIEQSPHLAQLLIERSKCSSVPIRVTAVRGTLSLSKAKHTDLYSLFLAELIALDRSVSCCEEAIARYFGIEPIQAKAWLSRARSEGHLSPN